MHRRVSSCFSFFHLEQKKVIPYAFCAVPSFYSRHTPIDVNDLTCDPTALIGHQKFSQIGDILWLAYSLERVPFSIGFYFFIG